jgi:hypothetical protein
LLKNLHWHNHCLILNLGKQGNSGHRLNTHKQIKRCIQVDVFFFKVSYYLLYQIVKRFAASLVKLEMIEELIAL